MVLAKSEAPTGTVSCVDGVNPSVGMRMRAQQAWRLPGRAVRIARLQAPTTMDPSPVTDLPPAEAVAAEIQAAQLATTPAELHGALCGWLAGGGPPSSPAAAAS
jgi:hypothetical protein